MLGSNVNVTNGFGVAALAFMAGFAAERTVLKVDAVGKTLFSVDGKPAGLTILEPTAGQNVAGQTKVHVAVNVPAKPGYITATCLEEATDPVPLVHQDGGTNYVGDLVLSGQTGTKTICVTAVVADQTLKEQVTLTA